MLEKQFLFTDYEHMQNCRCTVISLEEFEIVITHSWNTEVIYRVIFTVFYYPAKIVDCSLFVMITYCSLLSCSSLLKLANLT